MTEYSAGVILYKYIDNALHYLICRSEAGHFGFPKGHLEKGESECEAALREIQEEVGVNLTSLDLDYFFESDYELPNGNHKHVKYFVSEFEEYEGGSQEAYLLNYNDAYTKLTYDNDKIYLEELNLKIGEK